MVQLHSFTSSTSTRCRTAAIMPRISGRSSLITVSLMRCRPSARTVAFCSRGRSMALLRWVTFSLPTAPRLLLLDRMQAVLLLLGPLADLGGLHGLQHRLRRDLVHLALAEAGDVLGPAQRPQAGHHGVHDVAGVARARGLGQDRLDPAGLPHGADRAARDHAGPRRGRPPAPRAR